MIKNCRLTAVMATLSLIWVMPAWATDTPHLVVSIAPLAGIAAAITKDTPAEVTLLVKGNASPHTYQLTPQDARALSQATAVIWVGEGLENFLTKPLATLAPKAQIISLMKDENIYTLPSREGGLFEEESEDHHHDSKHEDEHHHGAIDPHLWLNPNNATAIAGRIAEVLAKHDPDHLVIYQTNALNFIEDLRAVDRRINVQLEEVRERPFIVFHDAYQYFVDYYRLKAVGSITLHPEEQPSAARVAALREAIVHNKVACVYAEPQFSPALLKTLTEGTAAGTGVLNADASDLPLSPRLYFDYLTRLAADFVSCRQDNN